MARIDIKSSSTGGGGGSGTVTSVSIATGTTGTNVNATGTVTSSGTLTVNVPVASATNTGKLTNTDWSTFNGKQAALVSGTNIKTINSNSILGSGDLVVSGVPAGSTGYIQYNNAGAFDAEANLFWDATNNRLGVNTATPGNALDIHSGADVVGMSTVPEVIVAVHSGLKTLGISIITDMCLPDALEPVKLEEIIATANEAEKKLRVLVTNIVRKIPD
jgi:hypothetical protein